MYFSKPKEFPDDNFVFNVSRRKFSKRVENAVGKGELARYEQFLLFPNCFQKTCTADTYKPGLVWVRVKIYGKCWKNFADRHGKNYMPLIYRCGSIKSIPGFVWQSLPSLKIANSCKLETVAHDKLTAAKIRKFLFQKGIKQHAK